MAFGYAGETGVSEARIGFSFGMSDWFFILKEIFMSKDGGAVVDRRLFALLSESGF